MNNQERCVTAFLDIGQGDSIVVLLPEEGKAVLVDCPKYRQGTVFKFLRDHHITEITLAVLTHTHRDHAGHFVDLIENFRANGGTVHSVAYLPTLVTGKEDTSENRQLLVGLAKMETMGVHLRLSLYPDLQVRLPGDVMVEALHPTLGEATMAAGRLKPNEGSVALKVWYKGHTVLLTGDLAGPGLESIVPRGAANVDAIQVPHHGAWDDALPTLIRQANAKYAVVSVGTQNDYDHPTEQTFQALRETSARVACTQATGRCVPRPTVVRDDVLPLIPVRNRFGMGQDNARACPCAGTVFIEMSSNGVELHPDKDSHSRVISVMTTPSCMWQA